MNKTRLTTTLNKLREHGACSEGYRKLLEHVGLDYPKEKNINVLTILESNNWDDFLWSLRATNENHERVIRHLAADIASYSLKFWEAKYPDDKCPHTAIQAARDFADGFIDEAAYSAAYSAACSAFSDMARKRLVADRKTIEVVRDVVTN